MRIDVLLESSLLTARSDAFARAVRFFAEAAVMVNREHIRTVGAPQLYASGIDYRMDYNSPTQLLDIASILEQGWAYCLSLACWRVAELREAGEEAAAIRIEWKTIDVNGQPKRLFHVNVRRASGAVEDPSKILGM